MALSQSALSELLEAFRAGDGVDLVGSAAWVGDICSGDCVITGGRMFRCLSLIPRSSVMMWSGLR